MLRERLRARVGDDPLSPARRRQESQIEAGMLAGVVSAGVTAVLLAIGGALAGVGPWVPFYAIIALVDPGALAMAQGELAQGLEPTYLQQQFVGGLGVCLVLGAVSGVVFALGVRRHPIRGWALYLLGAVHGILMMCFFYLGVLHTLGVVAGLEADAMSLSRHVGWPVLVAAHAVHGVVLAFVLRTPLAAEVAIFGRRGGDPRGSRWESTPDE